MNITTIMLKKWMWIALTLLVLGGIFVALRPRSAKYTHKLVPGNDPEKYGIGWTIAADQKRIVARGLGGIYIYDWDEQTNKFKAQKLAIKDDSRKYIYLNKIALSNDTIILGSANTYPSGAIDVYKWDGTDWHNIRLTASDAQRNDFFAANVAISGNRILASSHSKVYVYTFDGTTWQENTIIASDVASDENQVNSIAIDGNRIAVGANEKAYIYEWKNGSWQEDILKPVKPLPYEEFGASIAIDGERVVVGAPSSYEHMPLDEEEAYGGEQKLLTLGSIYIYQLSGNVWKEAAQFQSPRSPENVYSRFAESVDISGGIVAVRAFSVRSQRDWFNQKGVFNPSSFLLYSHSSAGWQEVGEYFAPLGIHRVGFAFDIAIGDGFVAIGSVNMTTGDGIFIYDTKDFGRE